MILKIVWSTWSELKAPHPSGYLSSKTLTFFFFFTQSLLHLLVLIQEQERIQLLKLLRGFSLQDLQEPEPRVALKEGKSVLSLCCLSLLVSVSPVFYADTPSDAVLRNGCVKKLRQIHANLVTQTRAQTPSINQHNPKMEASHRLWPQHQLELCYLVLLEELIELQEVQASLILTVLMHKVNRGSHI